MNKEELKQKFSNLYEKRKSFYEKHMDFAEKISFSRWQKNEFFQYFYEGTKKFEKSCDETQGLLDKQIEATHKLDVENAELKERNAELRKDCIESEEDNNKLRENIQKLAVAKDLIERLIHILVLSNTPYERYAEVQKEAEQFISEVEK